MLPKAAEIQFVLTEERSEGGPTIVLKPASTNDPALSTIGNTEIKNAMYPWVV